MRVVTTKITDARMRRTKIESRILRLKAGLYFGRFHFSFSQIAKQYIFVHCTLYSKHCKHLVSKSTSLEDMHQFMFKIFDRFMLMKP